MDPVPSILHAMHPYHPAFETLSDNELPEYRASGILLRHRKTGCEVYHLHSEDEENSFAFIFRTPPRDGSGVAHIVEHSVLCGSERYPVKDAFLVMARRSLATFLNAFTYPDKTVYPAASALPIDFYNLMSVYGDAVFFPKLARETFLQEAWHLALGAEEKLDITGVVYNEMRGDYSSADSLAGTACSTSLFTRGHPYSFDSGGNPADIPGLEYGAFLDFWKRCYHPSNCRIFLHGNIPTEGQLALLDARFLSKFEALATDTAVPLQAPFAGLRRVELPYPVAEGGESATQVIVNWLTLPVTDPEDSLALEVLAEVLLGHDGSPLARALRESGLGEDLSPQCGLDTGFRQAIFSAGLRGAKRGDEGRIEALILDCLRRLAAEGIPKEALEAALHSIAFANREIRRGAGTWGLRLMNRALRGWLHGMAPETTLSFQAPMAALRARLEGEARWLERFLERTITDNLHRSTITVFPERGLLERVGLERSADLRAREQALSDEERARIRAEADKLEALQAEADPPELLALLPRLGVGDIPRKVESVPRDIAMAAGCPVSIHPLFTNGIVYLDLAFPIDALPPETGPWLPLLSRFVGGAGLPGIPYGRVAERLTRVAGGFGSMLEAGRPLGPVTGGGFSSFMIFRLKALAENFHPALDLAIDLLTAADHRDLKRVGDLLAELGNDVISALVPGGNGFALARAGAWHSPALAAEERWRGMSQLLFLDALRATGDRAGAGAGANAKGIERAAGLLGAILPAIATRAGLRIGITADPSDVSAALAALERALPRLPSLSVATAASSFVTAGGEAPAREEAYRLSAQVGFVAAACRASRIGEPGYAHETVLAHILSTGPLWEEIRVRGGAYGASAYLEPLEGVFLLSTYRDPHPVRSLATFRRALEEAAGGKGLAAAEEAVVGTAGRDLKPLLPDEKGFSDFKRELYGITDAVRQAKRDALLDTGSADLRRAAVRLLAAWDEASAVLLSHGEDVESFGHERRESRRIDLPY